GGGELGERRAFVRGEAVVDEKAHAYAARGGGQERIDDAREAAVWLGRGGELGEIDGSARAGDHRAPDVGGFGGVGGVEAGVDGGGLDELDRGRCCLVGDGDAAGDGGGRGGGEGGGEGDGGDKRSGQSAAHSRAYHAGLAKRRRRETMRSWRAVSSPSRG